MIISVKAFNVPFKEGSYVIASDTMTKLADEFLKKLNTYGKLIDPKRGSEIVSRSILITVKDSKGPPKATYNPLKVGILLLIDQAPATSTDDGTKPADDGDAIKASGDTAKASSDATAANAVAISFEDHVADKRIDPTLVPATFAPRPSMANVPAPTVLKPIVSPACHPSRPPRRRALGRRDHPPRRRRHRRRDHEPRQRLQTLSRSARPDSRCSRHYRQTLITFRCNRVRSGCATSVVAAGNAVFSRRPSHPSMRGRRYTPVRGFQSTGIDVIHSIASPVRSD